MGKKKIFNDPVYGFISFPFEIIYDIIDHPYVQRLRRISQMGFSHYVYPGAIHSRFHHAMGALHLMTRALNTLKDKGIEITDEEFKAASLAILLHDVGHGPFSHALEKLIVPFHHEELSLAYMEAINEDYQGQLDLAIKIFKDEYRKGFLHQLVSGQLDVDRMDYLNRDSFFTGVAEGVIGYDRIIKMLNVVDDQLVVEEKGIYSIEKFLLSRRLMYLQVYLHKTSIAVEQMLVRFLQIFKNTSINSGKGFTQLQRILVSDYNQINRETIEQHATLDDVDVIMALKEAFHSDHIVLRYIAQSIIKRKTFKITIMDQPIDEEYIVDQIDQVQSHFNIDRSMAKELVITGSERNQAYNLSAKEIKILKKDGSVQPYSSVSTYNYYPNSTELHYICVPRI